MVNSENSIFYIYYVSILIKLPILMDTILIQIIETDIDYMIFSLICLFIYFSNSTDNIKIK